MEKGHSFSASWFNLVYHPYVASQLIWIEIIKKYIVAPPLAASHLEHQQLVLPAQPALLEIGIKGSRNVNI